MNLASARTRVVVLTVLLAALGALYFFSNDSIAGAEGKTRTITWLIAHQPTDVFAESIDAFDHELQVRSEGRLRLSVLTPEDLGYEKGDIPHDDVMRYLHDGTAELATTYSVALGKEHNLLWITSLPYLVNSYEDAEELLESDAAHEVLDSVSEKTDVTALAYTMSGGFRVLAAKRPISRLEDMRGRRIATSGGIVAEETLKALGAVPVPLDLEAGAAFESSDIDAIETTYSRLSSVVGQNSKYLSSIAETNHSLFLTVILADDAFFASLSESDRQALQDAARAAARIERSDSVTLGANTKQVLIREGSTIREFSDRELAEFRAASTPVYQKFEPLFGEDRVRSFIK